MVKLQERVISALEDSHNDQLVVIEHFRRMSEQNQKFSLEVINKSMHAVELLRTYKKERNNERKNQNSDSSNIPTNESVDNIEKIIVQCQ